MTFYKVMEEKIFLFFSPNDIMHQASATSTSESLKDIILDFNTKEDSIDLSAFRVLFKTKDFSNWSDIVKKADDILLKDETYIVKNEINKTLGIKFAGDIDTTTIVKFAGEISMDEVAIIG